MPQRNEIQELHSDPDYYGDEHDGSVQPGQTVEDWKLAAHTRFGRSRVPLRRLLEKRGVKIYHTSMSAPPTLGFCPFPDHVHDGTMTFWLRRWGNHFACGGCFRRGSNVEFLMHYHRINREEAARLLAIEEAELDAEQGRPKEPPGPRVTMADLCPDIRPEDLYTPLTAEELSDVQKLVYQPGQSLWGDGRKKAEQPSTGPMVSVDLDPGAEKAMDDAGQAGSAPPAGTNPSS